MRGYLKKAIALIMVMTLWCTSIPVWAMDEQETLTENSSVEENLGDDVETEAGDKLDSENINNMDEDAEEPVINYIYVESPYLETPGTQNIAVSLGKGLENISDVRLMGYRDNGEYFELLSNMNDGELFLFTKEFGDQSFSGSYCIDKIAYNKNGVENILSLGESQSEILFGVNQSVEGVTYSVTALNEEGEESFVAEVSNDGTENVEESIVETLQNVVGEEFQPFCDSEEEESKARVADHDLVIALDPGHDVGDAGAGYNNLKEEELVLEIANACKNELEKYAGVRVHMTRTNNNCPYGLPAGSKHAGQCIRRRVQDAARAGADLFVSFHLNASLSSAAKGAEIIIPNPNGKPDQYTTSKALAEKILAELSSLGLSNRGYYYKNSTDNETYGDGKIADYFSVQNAGKEFGVPGIIVEHAFISNVGAVDQSLLATSSGRQKLGVADANGLVKYLGLVKGQWVQEGNNWKFKLENGNYIKNQLFKIGKGLYYFDNVGNRMTGFRSVNGNKYYFEKDGAALIGWATIDNKKYYFMPDGTMRMGWTWFGKKQYYFDNNGVMATGEKVIDGKTYYFSPEGVLSEKPVANGWQTVNGSKYYFENSKKVTGWKVIDGKKYYFNPAKEGAVQTGWTWFGKKKYYFDSEGVMATGEKVIDGKSYRFDSNGVLQLNVKNGWETTNGKKYYYENGNKITGWKVIDGKKYYFNPAKEDAVQTGWTWFGKKKYYFDSEGVMATGEKVIDGKSYRFDSNGVLQLDKKNGWETTNGEKYYYENGNKVTGWKVVDDKKYYLNPGKSGAVQTGWTWFGKKKYYFMPDGVMLTGWAWFGKKRYFFDDNGVMATGDKTIEGKLYYFNKDGVLQEKQNKNGWSTEGGKKYYYENDIKVTGWKDIDGKKYYFNPSQKGAAQTGWTWFGKKKYYFMPDGAMLTGWTWFGKKRFYFDSNGVMATGRQNIDGVSYLFDDKGVLKAENLKQGWVTEGNNRYYYENGAKVTGWKDIDGKRYFFNATKNGAQQVGWTWFGKNQYYFDSQNGALKGWAEIDGKSYFFKDNYVYDPSVKKEEEKLPAPTYEIAGTSNVTKEKLVNWYKKNAKYPEFYATSDAPTIEDFCNIYIEEAKAEGIKVEVAFAQAMKETAWLKYGGDVKKEQFNFAGLGALGGVEGASFKNVREGVRAQIQHLKAYANKEPLKNECVDPRFHFVTRGSAKFVEWLGIKENPNNVGWATDKKYGYHIVDMIKGIQ